MKRKEVERTCKRDGTVWYVPLKAAREKAPTKLEKFGAKSAAIGSRLDASGKRGAGELRLANVEAREQRVRSSQTCPTCGSQSYTEKTVKL